MSQYCIQENAVREGVTIYLIFIAVGPRASIVAGTVITLSYALCTFYWVESSPATVHCVTTMGLHIHNLRVMRETTALDRFIKLREYIRIRCAANTYRNLNET